MTPQQIVESLSCFHRKTIPPDYLDAMNHMNVRYYHGLFDEAAWGFFAQFGLDYEYYKEREAGGFALQAFVRYLAEVRVGETVAIYGRVLGRSAKRIHYMLFMVNETTQKVAATIESLGSHADLRTRRTSPYPPEVSAKIDAILDEHTALPWEAPLCGAIQA